MKCPLRFMGCEIDALKPPETRFLCLTDDCAWWEPKIGKCAVLRMWIALQDIHIVLHDLVKRMPHEE